MHKNEAFSSLFFDLDNKVQVGIVVLCHDELFGVENGQSFQAAGGALPTGVDIVLVKVPSSQSQAFSSVSAQYVFHQSDRHHACDKGKESNGYSHGCGLAVVVGTFDNSSPAAGSAQKKGGPG